MPSVDSTEYTGSEEYIARPGKHEIQAGFYTRPDLTGTLLANEKANL